MSNILEFPSGENRFSREIDKMLDKLLDESLRISDPELRDCLKERMGETLRRYKSLPTLTVQVTLPEGVTEPMIQQVVDAVHAEYQEKVSEFALDLIGEICRLQAILCMAEIERDS